MDFSKAIEAHINWKRKLVDFISGKGDELDPNNAAKDSMCDVGKWIHTEGTKYEKIPEYQELMINHAKFHTCVGEIIKMKMKGETEKALKVINDIESDYKRYTSRTVNSIIALQNAIKKSETI
jgi:hypothetical protein